MVPPVSVLCVCVCLWEPMGLLNSCLSYGSQCCLCRISCFIRGFLFFQLSAYAQQEHCLRLITKYTSFLLLTPQAALLSFFFFSLRRKSISEHKYFSFLTFYQQKVFTVVFCLQVIILICLFRIIFPLSVLFLCPFVDGVTFCPGSSSVNTRYFH